MCLNVTIDRYGDLLRRISPQVYGPEVAATIRGVVISRWVFVRHLCQRGHYRVGPAAAERAAIRASRRVETAWLVSEADARRSVLASDIIPFADEGCVLPGLQRNWGKTGIGIVGESPWRAKTSN